MMSMKILWQNEHYPDPIKGGGGAINTYYIVSALQRLGNEVVILARGVPGGASLTENVDGITIKRLPVPELPARLWPLWPLLEPRYTRPSLLPFASEYEAFIGIDYSFALNAKKVYPTRPLIYRVEGLRITHDSVVGANGGKAESASFPLRHRTLRRLMTFENDLMERRAWSVADAIVVKSAFMKRELQAQYPIAERKIHVIPNGVDFQRYASAKVEKAVLESAGNPNREKTMIIFCGRLVGMKNVPMLLQAFSKMRLKDRCIVIIMGDGEEKPHLEDLAMKLGIAPKTKFLGHIANPEKFYAASDIFVLPSKYEPFGNALVEAMAAGLPCVALDPSSEGIRTASAEILVDGKTGYLVQADPTALARRLDELVENPALRGDIGQEAQRVCMSTYDWDSCADNYLNLAKTLRRRRA